jgi:uncharacterized protein YdeI (YjbR/CyaY-like superfamily)
MRTMTHKSTPGLITKKGARSPAITIEEALDVAVCYGWIDSTRRARDADTFLQRYSPRAPNSPWSTRNIENVERLLREGRMQPSGLAAVETARRAGRWLLTSGIG